MNLDNTRKDLTRRYDRKFKRLMAQGREDEALELTKRYMELDRELRVAIKREYDLASACRGI